SSQRHFIAKRAGRKREIPANAELERGTLKKIGRAERFGQVLSGLSLKNLRPTLCTVVDRENHDARFLDGISDDKRQIRDNQLPSARYAALPPRRGERS